jgi:hypothetical protein
VLRKAFKIVKKWLKVLIMKRDEGTDWVLKVLKVPRC